ncbi:uncharacterized protein PV09_03721 [Verruconis gallopava]|uniref:NADP-dependent oxidoreductase domain-containing protein n=1 Tax=Verruconis gallopava TaxID=253628 RepID=A0A0D2AFB5_9PEZI|nr:uncharacterized protein PV09_03721 [Verruconis gallopava]KIW05170.1 hypothetical protein PV09_03721 [Verruconis gallopava]
MLKASASKMVKISVGMMGSSVAAGSPSLATPAQVSAFLDVVRSHGVRELDTARVYNDGKSEELLGEVQAHKDFLIATKAPAFTPGSLEYDNIILNCEKSLRALRVNTIDLYYLHGPDPRTGFEEQCRAINSLHEQKKIDRWGISNLTPTQVQEVYSICEKNKYPLPTAYQGGYNPINRHQSESNLLPLLKRLNMTFYAYSPLAGGLLAKPTEEIVTPKKGTRFDSMRVFGNMYLNEENIAVLRMLQNACTAAGISLLEATMRWFMHHSPLGENDVVILGASSDSQIAESLRACKKGPLPETLFVAFEEMKNKSKVGDPFRSSKDTS